MRVLSVALLQLVAAANLKDFSCTGSVQKWTVPSNVKSVSVTATGGSGGVSFPSNPGHTYASKAGYGGKVTSSFDVAPGQTLDIYVGCKGGNGNHCGSGGCAAGGGGGATAILVGSDLKVVAGAGGGSSGANDQRYTTDNHGAGGMGGGASGTMGGTDGCGCGHNTPFSTNCGGGGRPGTQTASGAGGGGNRGEPNGATGSGKNGGQCGGKTSSSGGWGWGQGGKGCIRGGDGGGGGGGAGYFGGGGGGSGCHGTGGGGGSSFCKAGQPCSTDTTGYGYSPQHGSVQFSWVVTTNSPTKPPTPSPTVAPYTASTATETSKLEMKVPSKPSIFFSALSDGVARIDTPGACLEANLCDNSKLANLEAKVDALLSWKSKVDAKLGL